MRYNFYNMHRLESGIIVIACMVIDSFSANTKLLLSEIVTKNFYRIQYYPKFLLVSQLLTYFDACF